MWRIGGLSYTCTEAGNLLAGKVCPVIGDYGVGEFEATHDVLPKKFDLSSDFREWLCFNPFGEVVSGYQ